MALSLQIRQKKSLKIRQTGQDQQRKRPFMTAIKHFELSLRTETYDYRTPMKFGGRVVNDVAVLSVDCEMQTQSGTAAGQNRGLGSMTMGIAWAWPSKQVDDETKLQAVIALAGELAAAYQAVDQQGHAMDVCHRVSPLQKAAAIKVQQELQLPEAIPELAILLAGSPLESAIFDAQGKAAGVSSYQLLSRDHLTHDMGHYLDQEFDGLHLSDLINSTPVARMPLYHLVGALDPLTDDEVTEPLDDGLPVTLGEWINRNGLSHLKIKLDGDDLDWDVARVAKIDKVASESRDVDWAYSLDFNERCQDEAYVLELLERLEAMGGKVYDRIQYIEQPTNRDLESPGQPTMFRAAKRRPVVIDESLVGLESLRLAASQGYSGIALKACKGHSEALLLGAVARHLGMFLCVQDLTCVGASLLHSASLAAHIPSVAAVESNGRQYAPAGNQRWMERFGDFFEIRDGQIPTGQLNGPGLGYGSDPCLD
ncbi:hypothetical protein SV7mr_35710 [Stieleria bergensis]|uniref:Enolase C-terminal domain-containing protein n=2 Tax=Stieleria bergensis TaxID=2528025 RepID=A0A517SYD6_9BACT|nr:hypothetical protein SV7mr_35710 [Planctomycetes bacterium SV_7m_r]